MNGKHRRAKVAESEFEYPRTLFSAFVSTCEALTSGRGSVRVRLYDAAVRSCGQLVGNRSIFSGSYSQSDVFVVLSTRCNFQISATHYVTYQIL